MSTGIGNHKFSTSNGNIWSPDEAICPYCSYEHCEADHCDVGVGMVQCGPYHCPVCEASEISSLDTRELTEREKETGWFEPGSRVSDVANTVNGRLVDHREAKEFYDIGLLDKKSIGPVATEQEKRMRNTENRWCPDACPITGRPFFLWMNHPDLGDVPTYGGPYDSYTLAERHPDGSYYTRRYDHDEGGWIMDEVQDCGVRVVEDWLPANEAELADYVAEHS